MHGVGAAPPAGIDDFLHVEIGLGAGTSPEGDRRIRLAHERRIRVRIGVHGNGADPQLVCRADDAPGYLAAIGDEDPRDRPAHIRHVPNSLVPSTRLLKQADSAMATTVRVSRGSIMPSSETREVA